MHGLFIFAQHPFTHWTDAMEIRYSSNQPVIDYVLTVDPADTASYQVQMRIQNIPDTFRVAMVAHPEYDDRYWRFIENLHAEAKSGRADVLREDSALWKITTHGREVVLHYSIHLPLLQDQFRSSWKAFLTSTGGLLGGPHSFMYVVGATLAPSYVRLNIPSSWRAATGMQVTAEANTYFAPSVFTLIDDPIFVGKFHSWSFNVSGVPHIVTYWPLAAARNFDSGGLVSGLQKLVEQAFMVFGRLPYREYFFMLQDGAGGSLEHNNSVTIGAPSSQLATDMGPIFGDISHEYFHTWNLVRIHPVEYGDVSYKTPPLSKGLWFSEGLTMFYADLIRRRAGLPVFDSTRIQHLQTLIRRYFSSPAYLKYSAEEISLASYGPPGMLGDYSGSTHLQGEIVGTILDLMIRDATMGKSSMDDVMRKMMESFSGKKGFTTNDVEHTVREVCSCNVHEFFLDHIYGNKKIDFNKYLALAGLKMDLKWKEVLSPDGKAAPDLRVYAWQRPDETCVRLGVTTPDGCWARAGLHTRDILKSVNGITINEARDFRQAIREVKIGETVVVEVQGRKSKANVLITGYRQPEVHIAMLDQTSEKQRRLFTEWDGCSQALF